MPNYNVHPEKKIHKNEEDAKDLSYSDNTDKAPTKTVEISRCIGNPSVRRNEPDDED